MSSSSTVPPGCPSAFLPRVIDDDDSVLFEQRVGGVELASTSTAITNISQVPARELQNLRDAVDELKSKAEDPRCDRTKRQMIESFRLPDPQKDLIFTGLSARDRSRSSSYSGESNVKEAAPWLHRRR